MSFRQKLKNIPALHQLASLNLTTVCLILLFVLTLWGTIAQVKDGLYIAQERYFHSLYFMAFGFIPFPGAQLVMWLLFLNLIAVLLVKFVYSWNNIGILVTHFGLILFLVSGYVTLHNSKSSHLTLNEGQAIDVSTSFDEWELAIWENTNVNDNGKRARDITAIDIKSFTDDAVTLDKIGLSVKKMTYYRNCDAYGGSGENPYINGSQIYKIEQAPLQKEPSKNRPGGIFEVSNGNTEPVKVLLYGGETNATLVNVDGRVYKFSLRLIRYPLPFMVKLIDFIKESHPGTDTARSYKSLVAVETNDVWREKMISMNNPLRHNDFTFYQSSFSVDKYQNETSTLAVVENNGRLLPYIATGVTFAGLVIHFVMVAVRERKKRTKK